MASSIIRLSACLGVCVSVAVMAGWFGRGAWHEVLVKPAWAPPDLVLR